MKAYKAVIFDLFGTLIDLPDYPENRDEMADVLRIDRTVFERAWAEAMHDLMTGRFSPIEVGLMHICRRLGVYPGEERIKASARLRLEYSRGWFIPRPGVVETHAILRKRGYKVGLVSNCMEEVAQVWDSTPLAPLFEVVVLSCEVGLAKPNPRIYALATDRLGVEAQDCLYVGDGSDGELSGAERAGMTAVLMRAPYDQADGNRQSWEGRRISGIAAVLELVGYQWI